MTHGTVAEILTAAAVIAALIYLGRELRKLASVITFWSGLPKAHQALETATKQNTEALAEVRDELGELRVQVMHLAQVERSRGTS